MLFKTKIIIWAASLLGVGGVGTLIYLGTRETEYDLDERIRSEPYVDRLGYNKIPQT